MKKLNFKIWVESLEEKKDSMKSIILNILKDYLNINEDDIILNLKLSSIDKEIISDLLNRGIFKGSDEIEDLIKNSNITVLELIEKLSNE